MSVNNNIVILGKNTKPSESFWLDTSEIEAGETNAQNYSKSQVRTYGINANHVKELAVHIAAHGQEKPITVTKVVGHNLYMVTDGCHRKSAVELINKNPQNYGRASDQEPLKVLAEYQTIPEDLRPELRLRKVVQLRKNSHNPALGNTIDDVVQAVREIIDDSGDSIINTSVMTDKEQIEAIREVIDEIFENGYRHARSAAHKVFQALPDSKKKIKAYTKDAAVDAWNKLHNHKNPQTKTKLVWSKSGDDQIGHVVYFCDGHIDRMIGHIMNKRIDHSPKKITVVAWQGSAVGVDGTQIDEFREEVHTKLQKVNEYMRNLGGGEISEVAIQLLLRTILLLMRLCFCHKSCPMPS